VRIFSSLESLSIVHNSAQEDQTSRSGVSAPTNLSTVMQVSEKVAHNQAKKRERSKVAYPGGDPRSRFLYGLALSEPYLSLSRAKSTTAYRACAAGRERIAPAGRASFRASIA
jgi:hypothetical protein